MKKRIITAIVAVAYAILIIILTHKNPVFLLLSISAFCAISVRELVNVIKIKSKMLKYTSMAYGALVPLLMCFESLYYSFTSVRLSINFRHILLLLTIAYVLTMLHSLIKHYEITDFETVATLILGTICISMGLSLLPALSQLNYYYPAVFSKGDAMFIFIYSMVVCWTFDGGAYFIGSKFGKHKMAPVISPKKSWEGYIGGIVIGEICCVCYFLLFKHFAAADMKPEMINVLMIAIMSPILATASITGDLSASTIKRNFGVKDFGNFFPGHGGILDRFDSVLYVVPMLYIMVKIIIMVKQ